MSGSGESRWRVGAASAGSKQPEVFLCAINQPPSTRRFAHRRFVCYRNGPSPSGGTVESLGIKKSSDLPSWLSLDSGLGAQFEFCYTNLEPAVSNGSNNGRTRDDLALADREGGAKVDVKLRMKYLRSRQRYVRMLKSKVEECMMGGEVLDAYDNFLRLCVMNLGREEEIYFDDPEDGANEHEYIPGVVECLAGLRRMSAGVGGGIKRLEGLAKAMAVLIDKGNESNLGLPSTYVGVSPEVISRINGKTIKEQCEHFVNEVRRVLVSPECMCLDGACRSCLALLPKLQAEVNIIVGRIAGGGKLYVDGGNSGKILREIMELLRPVKLVDAKDVHYLANKVMRHMKDMDENDQL